MANTALALSDVERGKLTKIKTMVKSMDAEIAAALPAHMDAGRMARTFVTMLQFSPKLLDCAPRTLAASLIEAAQLGLECDGVTGHAYLVPYGKTCVLIPGYKGLMKLARQSGQISDIRAVLVWSNEEFAYDDGAEQSLTHIPLPPSERGSELRGCYAVAQYKDGTRHIEWMWLDEIDAIRYASKAATAGPWVAHYGEMAKKTVVRRLGKYLELSPQLSRATSIEDVAESGRSEIFMGNLAANDITPDFGAVVESAGGVEVVTAALASKKPEYVVDGEITSDGEAVIVAQPGALKILVEQYERQEATKNDK